MLMCGPPGVGKTEMAKTIASEMGTESKEAIGQNLRTGAQMAGFLLSARERDVFFIDEMHELRTEAQTQLYRAMLDWKVFVRGGPFGGAAQSISVPQFTLLAATTDEFSLLKPLRDRFDMTLHFSFYTVPDLIEILARRIRCSSWSIEPVVPELIAARSKGVPRVALRLLASCCRVARSRDERTISVHTLHETCRIERIDALGLNAAEQSYLAILASSSAPVRPTTLGARLGLPLTTIQTVTEEFMIRAGLIERTPKGRVLTLKGLQHLRSGADA